MTPPCFDVAGKIGVAERVAGAIDARALAVPHAEHAIELAFAAQFGLLGAPQRRGGELLVDAGLELDVGGGEPAGGADELLVEPAERRAAVAGDKARRVEARATVALFLHQAGADQRLIPGHEYMRLGKVVFILEADRSKRHGSPCHAAHASASPTHIGLPRTTQSVEFTIKAIPQGLPVNFVVDARSRRKFPRRPSARILAQCNRQSRPSPMWVVKFCAACQKGGAPELP